MKNDVQLYLLYSYRQCSAYLLHFGVPPLKNFANVSLPHIPHSQRFTWGQMEEKWRKIIFLPLGGPSLPLVNFLLIAMISFQA